MLNESLHCQISREYHLPECHCYLEGYTKQHGAVWLVLCQKLHPVAQSNRLSNDLHQSFLVFQLVLTLLEYYLEP